MNCMFRVDGNPIIGMGHIMRCLSVADELSNRGVNTLFVVDNSVCCTYIIDHGHKCISLDTSHDQKDNETTRISEIIEQYKPDLIVGDSYFFTQKYNSMVFANARRNGIKVVLFDSTVEVLYSCDAIINYNIYGEKRCSELTKYYKENPSYTIPEFICGPKYVPLRKEFQNLGQRRIRNQGKCIMVSTGGADPTRITLEIINNICNRATDYQYNIIVGKMNQDIDIILELSKNQRNVNVLYDINKISEIMINSDVAISAAGSTLYELCAAQTPTITYALANNQIRNAEEFAKKQIMVFFGDIGDKVFSGVVNSMIDKAIYLCNSTSERQKMAKRMRMLVDGHGAERLVERLLS